MFDKCYLCLSDDVVKETKKIVKYISKKNDIKKTISIYKKTQIAILIFNSIWIILKRDNLFFNCVIL